MTEATSDHDSLGAGVSVEGVSKWFHSSQQDSVHVLDDISVAIRPGEIVALTGHSGCGKTTLLRIVMGLERASSGIVRVSGKPVDGPARDRGMVFQQPNLLPWRSALGNVEFGLEAIGIERGSRRRIAEEHLRLVGLADAMGRRPDQLSGGMEQRVGMARALAVDPGVLVMDEPFAALDAQTRESLQAELLGIHARTQKTIMFVTHDLDEAVLLADRIVVMSAGPGAVHDVVEVKLPRPRVDLVEIRKAEEFVAKRYQAWKSLRSSQRRSASPAEDAR